jgi:endonuclease G
MFWATPHQGPTAPAPPEELLETPPTPPADAVPPEEVVRRANSGHEEAPAVPVEVTDQTLKGPLADAAREAWAKLRSLRVPTREEAHALDEILRTRRPALRLLRGRLEGWPQGRQVLGPDWNQFRQRVVAQTRSVGRIEYADEPIGTGFVVADRVIATNRHVVDHLFPNADHSLKTAGIRFGLTETGDSPLRRLSEVLAVGDSDIALIRLDAETCPEPLTLSRSAPSDADVGAVVGYPFADTRVPAFADANFADNYSYVTISPGKVVAVHRRDRTVDHDCQTLGGNSGSPLLSLHDGSVLGVHFEGRFLANNSAVSGQALRDLLKTIT